MDGDPGLPVEPPDIADVGKCTVTICADDKDIYKLKCKECKRLVHYTCTQLPTYQLQLFLFKSYRQYICVNCINVTKDLDEICNKNKNDYCPRDHQKEDKRSEELEQIIFKMQTDINSYEKLLKTYEECSKKEPADHSKILAELAIASAGLKQKEEEHSLEKSISSKLAIKLKCLQTDMNKQAHAAKRYRTEVKELQVRMEEREKSILDLEHNETKLNNKIVDLKNELEKQQEKFDEAGNPDYDALTKFENFETLITQRLDSVEETIKESLFTRLNEKMKETNDSIINMPEKLNESFKNALTKNLPAGPVTNFKDVMCEERNKQLVQDRERKRRAMNIIIHGVNEVASGEGELDGKEYDKKYVDDLMQKLGVNHKPESIVRLGKTNDSKKSRPLKVRFQTEEEKERVMSHLSNLKNAEHRFSRISITHDYTIEERQEIKRYVEEAKHKNSIEKENFFWRVRGSPKTGLELKRVPKKMVEQSKVQNKI